ncbi:MAG: O-methyltransferase [Clostridia bacterium]|nr:O-methyltransferase [Clostridia bacterium]
MNLDYITEYLSQVLPESKGILKELEIFAKENQVPVIYPEVRSMLDVLCKIHRPARILEIGTAIGYSALVMNNALNGDVSITTVERDPVMSTKALENFRKAKADNIRLIEDDGVVVLDSLSSKFDMIFIDAAKGYYNEFFDRCINLINDNGLIICDNVLYKGMTATDELLTRHRQKTIVVRMREFLEMICNHPKLSTSIIPIGDGVSVSYYKEAD